MGTKKGPDMFAALTDGERHVLNTKLTSGGVAASFGTCDHATALEIFMVNADVAAPWAKDEP